jgi:site-specific DNA-methyltransferase (adenine-specific)
MAEMEDESVDSIVCDPPYELGFMGKSWDSTGIAYDVEVWKQCLRVLKPGGHLLAFGGSRTYHRLACAVEDAGFEIRDQIMWVYGSGFPKSLNIGKAMDKHFGAERDVIGEIVRGDVEKAKTSGVTMAAADANKNNIAIFGYGVEKLTAPATDEAKQWEGWGTALKPAHEPIVVARKPLVGTVAANVLKHGTGALNIGACRIEGEPVPINRLEQWSGFGQEKRPDYEQEMNTLGRWPANVIHDGSDEVLDLFAKAGDRESGKSNGNAKVGDSSEGVITPLRRGTLVPRDDEGTAARFFFAAKDSEEDTKEPEEYVPNNKNNVFGEGMGGGFHPGFGDDGSAARFFYCAKASGDDRHEGMEHPGSQFEHGTTLRKVANATTGGNNHPTVKPTSLMRYLCRLVTRPGGTVLDPFAGSGSTGKGAILEGFNFIGIEMNKEYCEIAKNRVIHAIENDMPLFAGVSRVSCDRIDIDKLDSLFD